MNHDQLAKLHERCDSIVTQQDKLRVEVASLVQQVTDFTLRLAELQKDLAYLDDQLVETSIQIVEAVKH